MAVEAGGSLYGSAPFLPKDLSLYYWFASFPREPEPSLIQIRNINATEPDILDLVDRSQPLPMESFVLTCR